MKVLFALLGAASLILLASGTGAEQAGASQRHPYAGFPLNKDVAGNGPMATLDEGQLPNGTLWGAWASRVGKGRIGHEQPCLSLAWITRYGEYRDAQTCGVPPPSPKTSRPVYVAMGSTFSKGPNGPLVSETVLGLTFRPSVRSAVLKYADGGEAHRRTEYFNLKQQRKTKLPPFRYIAMALQKDVCVETVVGYSKHGSELFSADTGLCF